jgi:hypothetical protein
MTKLKISSDSNINYLAKVVKLTNIRKHSNADRLQITTIDGNNIIVDLNTSIGDTGVFFPVESQLSDWFLKENNLYDDSTMNKDSTKRGFVNKTGRIRAVKLRGEASEGLFLPLTSLIKCFDNLKESDFTVNTEFDSVVDKLLIKKYVVKQQISKSNNNSKPNNQPKKLFNKLIENQFRFHDSTPKLGANVHKVHPDDLITITSKLHGTSVVLSNILCKRPLTVKERIAKFFGVPVIETHYDNVYSSRTVVKNKNINTESSNNHYYKTDIWGQVNGEYKSFLEKGITLYGEIVGYLDGGGYIQKGYSYGCQPNSHDFYVYRITTTNVDGKVIEFSWEQIVDYCNKYGIKYVPLYYHGLAKNLFPELNVENHWNENFLERMKQEYLEKMIPVDKVPDEGVVLRIEKGLNIDYFKLKSFLFLEGETKALDKGEVDVESES